MCGIAEDMLKCFIVYLYLLETYKDLDYILLLLKN